MIRTPGSVVITWDPSKPNNSGIDLENFGWRLMLRNLTVRFTILGLIGMLLPTLSPAQAPSIWLTAGGGLGIAGGAHYASTPQSYGLLSVAWTTRERRAFEVGALASRNLTPISCIEPLPPPPCYREPSLVGGTASLLFLRGPQANPSTSTLGIGAGAYRLPEGGDRNRESIAPAIYPAIQGSVTGAFAAGRVALSFEARVAAVFPIEGRVLWFVPIGLGVRAW